MVTLVDELQPLDSPAGSAPHRPNSPDGKYHFLMELGRGGTGVVSAAIARGIGGVSKLVVLD